FSWAPRRMGAIFPGISGAKKPGRSGWQQGLCRHWDHQLQRLSVASTTFCLRAALGRVGRGGLALSLAFRARSDIGLLELAFCGEAIQRKRRFRAESNLRLRFTGVSVFCDAWPRRALQESALNNSQAIDLQCYFG